MQLRLIPHPATPSAAITQIGVDVSRPRPDALLLRYSARGNVSALRLPSPAAPVRTDDLWRHTCFEAFLQPGAGPRYFEINLSPSTQWATYAFDDTRTGMRNAEELSAPGIDVGVRSDGVLELRAALDLRLAGLADAPWRLGLSAVFEETNGAKSYWALDHRGGRPDFHDPLTFTLDLPVPDLP